MPDTVLDRNSITSHIKSPPPTNMDYAPSGSEQSPLRHSSQPTPMSQSGMSESTTGGVHNSAPSSQVPGHPSFRRQRASRACETCHARKVRCDAASLGVPCTNCVAFSIECKIPAPKRKKTQSKAKETETVQEDDPEEKPSPPSATPSSPQLSDGMRDRISKALTTDHGNGSERDSATDDPTTTGGGDGERQYAQMMKPKFVRAPIKEAGRVAYLGESSNLSLLVHDRHGTADVVHYPLPDNIKGPKARMDELDNVEIDILHQRGAFLLPPRGLCDELVDAYFTWIAPIIPVINRSRFMRRYRDSKHPPSLLLLQAILLAGSRVCKNPQLMDANGSTTPAAMTFYKRAKALFDSNYEDDRITIVQALILMGWYWEGPEDVTKNVFYWSRVAIIVAQGSGMHRSVEMSQLSKPDKRLWKRIWWTLFTRDRSVAVALGRPCCINTDDSDVEMVSEDDFIDDEEGRPAEYPADPVHVHFFLNYVKLTEIMGLVLSQQYSVAGKGRKANALELTHSDMALADWLQNCPKEVRWEKGKHEFFAALLNSNYYTTLCLLHRAHMPPAGTPQTTVHNGQVIQDAYPSRNIAYQAAGMITSIVDSLKQHDQIRYTPAFIVYSLFSALIMHIYQMRSSNAAVVKATELRISTCMQALKDVAKVWLVAKMVHTLFESILGNKVLEERLQKAAGRRHQKDKRSQHKDKEREKTAPKRKFDDVDSYFPNVTPAAPVSYERSRPQTPAATPGRQASPSQEGQQAQQQQVPNITTNESPAMKRNSDAFMGNSRSGTRAATPLNPAGPSMPGTPPDLFLVTRNSPTIPHDLWNNFQPDQLFPAETNAMFSNAMISPEQNSAYIDPRLAAQPRQMQATPPGMSNQESQSNYGYQSHQHLQPNGGMRSMHMPGSSSSGQQMNPHLQQHQNDPHGWAQLNAMNQNQQPQGDMETWSNSSMSQGPIVPTTLNVEDWFQFFGFTGEMGQSMQQSFST